MRLSIAMVALAATALPTSFLYFGCSSSSANDGGAPSGSPDGSTSEDDASACKTGGGADGGRCLPGTTPAYTSCETLPGAPVSFATDIQPIFTTSCAAGGSSCHGDPTLDEMATGQVFLGYAEGGVPDAGQVIDGLVGQKSPENTNMDIVAKGDPANSYMMHKLDQDECQYSSTCNATHNANFSFCGLPMPYQAGILDQGTRDTIRRWIAQGAPNN